MEPRCPGCRSRLDPGPQAWDCRSCGREYPALRGIPDLRTFDDLYLPNEEDWSIARALDRDFDRLDFRGLLGRYFEIAGNVPASARERQIAHILTATGRAGQWVAHLGAEACRGPLLDLGCGSGSFLAARAAGFPDAIGVDIAMRWLILARKRLDEAGFSTIALICACAENLPLPDRSFRAVVAGDVIEHVNDQAATLAESHRVLRAGGRLVLATPNRFSLACEPHVGVWGVGFLPRRWMRPYVRLVSKRDFRAIRTLGHGEWKRLLQASRFASTHIEAPPLPADDLRHFGAIKRTLATIHNAIAGLASGQAMLRRCGPLFHIVAEKRDSTTRPPTPATPPRSTPRARSR